MTQMVPAGFMTRRQAVSQARGFTFNYEMLKAGNEDIQVRSELDFTTLHP